MTMDERKKSHKDNAVQTPQEKYREEYRKKVTSNPPTKKKSFRKIQNFALKLAMFGILAGGAQKAFKSYKESKENVEQDSYVPSDKYLEYRKYEDGIVPIIAFVEDFYNDHYYCGAKETIGYGTTKVNGERVTENTPSIDRTLSQKFLEEVDPSKPYMKNIKEGTYMRAKEYVIEHLEREVYPFIENSVDTTIKQKMSYNEMLATIMFIYNVGGEAFSGRDVEGKKIYLNEKGKRVLESDKEAKPLAVSSYLTALNAGEKGEELAKKITGFRSVKGEFSKGLLKLRWVNINVLLNRDIETKDKNGVETVRDFISYIPELKPAGFYNEKDMSRYYKDEMKSVAKDGYYTPKLDNETLAKFIKKNHSDKKNVASILDKKTLRNFYSRNNINDSNDKKGKTFNALHLFSRGRKSR